MSHRHQFETLAVHAGQPPDPQTGAVMTPVYLSSTYRQQGVGAHQGFEYSRTGNPTRKALEDCIAELEGGARGLAFASGMAAIDAVIQTLNPGDHVLAADDLYGGTYRLFEKVYARYGLAFSYAPTQDSSAFLSHLREETRLVWLESPTNPLLNLCDIDAIASGAHRENGDCLVGVDSTFATPYLQRPLELGADIVVHSTTKYLGGHSDVVGGAIAVRDAAFGDQLAFLQNAVGAVPGPLDCFLVLRGIKTLAVRMDRHAQNAERVAHFLEQHPLVTSVLYPTLDSHPQCELAKRQMRNGGGMIAFTLANGQHARPVVEATHIFTLAESLGGVESLIELPAAMTHASTVDSPLEIDPGLIRLSIGLESADDLIEDLDQALKQAT